MKKILAGLTVLVFALLIVNAVNIPDRALATEDQQDRIVSVTGEARLTLKPDTAMLSLGVETEHEKADQAAETNAQKMNKVVSDLQNAGIEKKDMETQNYSLRQVTRWNEEKRVSEVVGYKASNTIQVTTKELDKLGEYLDVAVAAGANNISSPTFSLSNKQDVKKQLLEDAVLNAKDKAQVMVASVNASLGPVKRLEERNFAGSFSYRLDSVQMESKAAATPIYEKDLEISVQIYAEFIIK